MGDFLFYEKEIGEWMLCLLEEQIETSCVGVQCNKVRNKWRRGEYGI